MESLEVRRRIEALELRRVEPLEPGHIERLGHVVRGVVARVESADDRRQGGLAICPGGRGSRQQLFNHLAADLAELLVAAFVEVGELIVVQA